MKKKEKYIRIFELFLFRFLIIVLAFGMLVNVMMPDRKFSASENRSLTTFPTFTWDSFVDGNFTDEMNEWFSDQFIGRSLFINIRYLTQKLFGQKEINGVYLTSKGLMEEIQSPNTEEMDRNLAAINTLYRTNGVNTYFMVVPNSATVNESSLPWTAQTINQKDLFDYMYASLDEGIIKLDTIDALKEHSKEYLYYKSDEHWTSLGAYYALESAAPSLGISDMVKSNYDIYPVSTNFRGSLSDKIGAFDYVDQIDIYVPKNAPEYLFINDGIGSKSCTVYNSSALETKDQYSVFMSGDSSMCRLDMNNASPRHLMVIKDSYANCLIPMLIPYYRTITVVDANYYYENIQRLIVRDSITDILYLYNGNTFVQDTALADMIESSY